MTALDQEPEVCKRLDDVDIDGHTALYHACKKGARSILGLLMMQGADISNRPDEVSSCPTFPLPPLPYPSLSHTPLASFPLSSLSHTRS